jgi:hypothetical protein
MAHLTAEDVARPDRPLTGYCAKCWALEAAEYAMVGLAVAARGWVAVARPHQRHGALCIGSGLPLERVA